MKANSALGVLLISLFGAPSVTLAQAPDVKANGATDGKQSNRPKPVAKRDTTTGKAASGSGAAETPPNGAATPEPHRGSLAADSKSTPTPAATPSPGNVPATPAASGAAVPPTSNTAAIVTPLAGSSATTQGAVSGVPESAQSASMPNVTESSAPASTGPSTSAQAAVAGPHAIAMSAAAAQTGSSRRPPKLRYPLSLQLDVVPVWQLSNGYDAFSTNDIATRVGLSAGYDVLDIAPHTPVGLELGWSTESHETKGLFQGLDTAFSAHNLHGGLKLRHQLFKFLAPYANVLAGAARMRTTFEVTSSDRMRAFETVKWTPFVMLGAGLAAMLPIDNRIALGVSAEAGYLVSGSMPLRLDPKDASGALPGANASMGALERSGPYLRFGCFVRY